MCHHQHHYTTGLVSVHVGIFTILLWPHVVTSVVCDLQSSGLSTMFIQCICHLWSARISPPILCSTRATSLKLFDSIELLLNAEVSLTYWKNVSSLPVFSRHPAIFHPFIVLDDILHLLLVVTCKCRLRDPRTVFSFYYSRRSLPCNYLLSSVFHELKNWLLQENFF